MSDLQQRGPGQPSAGPSADVLAMMRYDANKKSSGVAYLLWFFLGGVGAHRFYMGSIGWGIAYIVLFLLGLVIGLTFFIIAIMWIVDAFLIPGVIRRHNMGVAAEAGVGSVFS